MAPVDYRARLLEHLVDYKHSVLRIREPGIFLYRGTALPKEHILPLDKKWENLLDLARPLAEVHLASNRKVRPHRYFHHLNSSQAFSFNLFFPFFGGGAAASSALLRALGQQSLLASWEPEAVPDENEGTNLDARWQLVGGTTVLCEVKLSEADFGKARADPKHRRKLRDIYRPRLDGHVDARMLREAEFFRAYQIYRNVWHMLGVPGSKLLFLIPRANARLWNELGPALDALSPKVRKRVGAVAIEDVLSTLRADTQCPAELRIFAGQLEAKYVVGAS